MSRSRKKHPAGGITTAASDKIGILPALGVVLALAATVTLRTKRHDAGSVSEFFHFDRYKEIELSQRGVQDKTRWR